MNQLNLDPITTEIIQSSLQAACDEMFVAMRKIVICSYKRRFQKSNVEKTNIKYGYIHQEKNQLDIHVNVNMYICIICILLIFICRVFLLC